MPRVEVPVEISSGEEPVVVRVAEEVVAPPSGGPAGEAFHLQPTLTLRTVVHVAVVGGGRVGLLAQIAGAIAAQGLSVSEATAQVCVRGGSWRQNLAVVVLSVGVGVGFALT